MNNNWELLWSGCSHTLKKAMYVITESGKKFHKYLCLRETNSKEREVLHNKDTTLNIYKI